MGCGEEHLRMFRFIVLGETIKAWKGEGLRWLGKEQAWKNRKG